LHGRILVGKSTNAFDGNGRMTVTSLVNSGGTNMDMYAYAYNVGNQRSSVTRSGENYADYTYDAIGQVVADQAYEVSGGAARMNEQLHYGFDPAGNLNNRTNNMLIENFQVNTLNELTANTNGGRLTVMGTTTSTATNVSVNSTNALLYGDTTFAATNMPLTTSYTAAAADSLGRHSTNTVTVNVATNNSVFQYDGNGNLTNDGLRSFAYDDENQLIQVWVTTNWFSQFSYDGKMRRRIRQEYTWQGGAWVQTNEVYYVYDGNEVIQERNNNNLPTTTYTRGKDLSGSLEGAGGIGGLLSMTLNFEPGPLNSNSYYYHADGNGNVTMLINASQYIVAKYLYDAFGNILSMSGQMAPVNLIRFSSKEFDPNSGDYYYLYRYYDPHLQRWPNRDPIGEQGGYNLFGFVGNDPLDGIDPLGYSVTTWPIWGACEELGTCVITTILVPAVAACMVFNGGDSPPPDPCKTFDKLLQEVPRNTLTAVNNVIRNGGDQGDLNNIPGLTPAMRQLIAALYNAAADCFESRGRQNSDYNRKRACFVLGDCPNPGRLKPSAPPNPNK
jgi:RHS repeat-associated protein